MVNNFFSPAPIVGEAEFAFSLRCLAALGKKKRGWWLGKQLFEEQFLPRSEAKSGVNHDCNKLHLRMRFPASALCLILSSGGDPSRRV